MYMDPVVRTRAALPSALHLAVGAPVLLLVAVVMLPWLALIALAATAEFAVRILARLPRVLVQAVDYAGKVTLGR